MIDFGLKQDYATDNSGKLTASEVNNLFAELKNILGALGVTPDGLTENQLAKAIDSMVKTNVYKDIGSINTIILSKGITGATPVESYIDGATFIFEPKYVNTGATTIAIGNLAAIPAYANNVMVSADYFKLGYKYMITYNKAANRFDCELLTLGIKPGEIIKNISGIIKDGSGNTIFDTNGVVKSVAPTLILPNTISELDSVVGNYTCGPYATVRIKANFGTISNIDTVTKTFKYTAPDITTDSNITDTITIQAVEPGYIASNVTSKVMTVLFVPLVADAAIVNSDYTTNAIYNDGFAY